MSSINSQTKYGEMYRDYANNFLTVEKFAEHYGISIDVAVVVIGAGRMIQDNRAEIERLRVAVEESSKWLREVAKHYPKVAENLLIRAQLNDQALKS